MKLSRVKIDDVVYVRAKAIEGEAALLRAVARGLVSVGYEDPAHTAALLRTVADRLDLGAAGERPAPVGWDAFVAEFVRPLLLSGRQFAGVVLTPEDCTHGDGFGGWKVRVQRVGSNITDYFHKCSGMDRDEVLAEAADWFVAALLVEQLYEEEPNGD